MNTTLEPTTINQDDAWRAVCNRDRDADGSFVFAVRTTGVYCRPSCPARRPNRENVSFHPTPADARRAGFRACKRCGPDDEAAPAVLLVQSARRLIAEPDGETPTLAALSATLGVSSGYLQRSFKRITGVSPRQYAESRRVEALKSRLRAGEDITGAAYEAGYGSSSRVYENGASLLGMTPGRYRRGGEGLQISYEIAPCSLGLVLVASTERGVCFVALADTAPELETAVREEYPLAELHREEPGPDSTAATVVRYLEAGCRDAGVVSLDLRGTAFQLLVWQALQAIPPGETRTYQQLALQLARPGAARAVGRACATNPVSLLVPCHRAIRGDGSLAGYRWDVSRKRALLQAEREGVRQTSSGA